MAATILIEILFSESFTFDELIKESRTAIFAAVLYFLMERHRLKGKKA